MDVKLLSVFGLYSQKENKVTAALLQVLECGGASLLRYALSKLGSDLNPTLIDRIECQANNEGTGSVPDGKIVCSDFTLFLESKLDCSIPVTQKNRHVKLLKTPNNYLVYITNHPVRPKDELPDEVLWTNWDNIASWFMQYETSDVILRYLIHQFKKLIDSLFKEVRYYKDKGILRVADNVKVHSMTDAYNIFDAKAADRGFLKAGTASIPNLPGYEVWCSKKGSNKWDNVLSDDFATYKEGIQKTRDASEHVRKCIEENKIRVTFYQDKDRFKDNTYHFIGVYELNKTDSLQQKKCVWEKKADEIKLR